MKEAGRNEIKIYVIGNKSDLEAENTAEIRKLASEIAEKQTDHYEEVSAKTKNNIDKLFDHCIEDLLSANKKKTS